MKGEGQGCEDIVLIFIKEIKIKLLDMLSSETRQKMLKNCVRDYYYSAWFEGSCVKELLLFKETYCLNLKWKGMIFLYIGLCYTFENRVKLFDCGILEDDGWFDFFFCLYFVWEDFFE